MSTKHLVTGLVVVSSIFIIIFFFQSQRAEAPKPQISSFLECEQAGYPIMESYPRQCRTAEGNLFVEIIDSEEAPLPEAPPTAPAPKPTTPTQTFNTEIDVKLGGVLLFPDGLKLILKEINDSRCPADAQCIWAGEISAVFSVEGGDITKNKEIRLGTTNEQSLKLDGYVFELKQADTALVSIKISKI